MPNEKNVDLRGRIQRILFPDMKYLESVVEHGEVRISSAANYNDGKFDNPRSDDEVNKERRCRNCGVFLFVINRNLIAS